MILFHIRAQGFLINKKSAPTIWRSLVNLQSEIRRREIEPRGQFSTL